MSALSILTQQKTSHWKVVLSTGKEITEHQLVFDFRGAKMRRIDWALDLNSTGDVKRIKELWLMCPDGQKRVLKSEDSGTLFQFKYGMRDFIGGFGSSMAAQIIGKITNKEEGTCFCYIWDVEQGLIEYTSSIYNFGMWKANSGLIPLTKLGQDIIGTNI